MNNNTYRPEIDGLRAIAVSAVVLYHAGVGPASGYAGVDMFFVISGYLITWLLTQESRERGRIDLLAFYGRRVRRILPAAMLVILSTTALSFFLLPGAEQQQVYQSAISGLLFFANLFFWQHSGGYFDHPSVELPLIHLWSLSVEEQFYLIWPLILVAILRVRASVSPIIAPALILLSLAFAEYLIHTSSDAAFYVMPARFWELAIGGWIALRPNQGRAHSSLSLIGCAAVIAGLAFPISHFPGMGASPTVLGTALLLWMLHVNSRLGPVGHMLRLAPVNYLGRISYSFYLWHWPVLAFYHATGVGINKAICLALCALALLLAALTYRYVETPFRKLSMTKSRAGFVAWGGTASLCMALTIFAFGRYIAPPAPLETAPAAIQEMDFATRTENDQTPYRYQCSISPIRPPEDLPDASCASRLGMSPKVAVLGDSYANSWQALAWAMAQKLDLSAINYSRSGCPIFLSNFDDGKPARDAICRKFNAYVVTQVEGFDSILIAVRWDARKLEVNEEGMRATLAAMAPTVRKIYILGPSPVMHDRVPKCIRANQIDACAIARKDFEKDAAPMRTFLRSLTRQYKNVEYVELGNFLCTKEFCPAIKDGIALYADQSHVTYSAARKFAAEFVKTMH